MSGGFDPSNLHLKKELTQIRKASKALKDPGTTSTWRSPLSSGRSAAIIANATSSSNGNNNHYYHHYRNNSNSNGNVISGGNSSFEVPLQIENSNLSSGRGKEKGVFLYNWKAQKSESEKSVQSKDQRVKYRDRGEVIGNNDDGDDLSSVVGQSVDDSMSDARHGGGDSKSDTYIGDKYASMIYKYKNRNLTPAGKRNIVKKKVKRSAHSSALLRRHEQQIVLSRSLKPGAGPVPLNLRRDDSVSLVDQSDDTSEFFNSEDLRRYSAESPLLARLKSSNLLRGSCKEDSSYSYSTPAMSTSSYRLYGVRNPSTVGSWDATTESLNDGDDGRDFDLAGQQGCGIPCYWSKRSTPKSRGACRSCYSPSLSDILKRKGSSMLCGTQSMHNRRRHVVSRSSGKKRVGSRTAQGLVPLLSSSAEGKGGSSLENSTDELSTNYGELDLEALSRLDGRRWSVSCRSQEGLELVALNGERESGSSPENLRSLSQKYRPVFFEELIGQNIVVQSLTNAIPRGRIAPVYLFQGPRGTGKTSTARIFAAALNCLANEENKPCGVCRNCAEFVSGKSKDLVEVDSSEKKGIDKLRHLLKTLLPGPPSAFSLYRVFVIDECHLLPAKMWLAFLKFLEEPPPRVLFIFITTNVDNIPRTVLSRCQKYLFNKIKEGDIVSRLRKIAAEENLDVESDALDLIALNADGSLRDAETMLDQLTLLGKRITTSLVNELVAYKGEKRKAPLTLLFFLPLISSLYSYTIDHMEVGVVSDEKLLELLELAMSSDTAETVKRARELMDSGIDPMVLMSQLAALIMDIIAGTYQVVDAKYSDSFIGGRSLNEVELERLKHALKLLSEAEQHLRVSSERSTWFTATLLQLGSVPSPDPTQSVSSRRQSSRTTEEDPSSTSREVISKKLRPDNRYTSRRSSSPRSLLEAAQRTSTSQEDPVVSLNAKPTQSQYMHDDTLTVSHKIFGVEATKSNMLNDIWLRCIERCHSKTLRQLLHTYGKLVSVSEVEGAFVAYIAFSNSNIKIRAERFLSSITNAFEIVLQHNVEVRIVLLPDDEIYVNSERQVALLDPMLQEHTTEVPLKVGSFNDSDVRAPKLLVDENAQTNGTKDNKSVAPAQRIESIIHEQRLETAWLQIAEKGNPGSLNRAKPERNQVLPQDGIYHHNQIESMNPSRLTSQHWEDELNDEISALKVNDGKESTPKVQFGKRADHYQMSPSLLHNSSYSFSKESMGYESSARGGGCSGLFCWKNAKHYSKEKIKQQAPVRKHKGGRFMWLGECAKSTKTETSLRR